MEERTERHTRQPLIHGRMIYRCEQCGNALNGPVNPKRARRGWDLTMAWDRKEAREKRQAVERETASRFHQRKAKESAWAVRKRTRSPPPGVARAVERGKD